jgi:hypothetical protein
MRIAGLRQTGRFVVIDVDGMVHGPPVFLKDADAPHDKL